eukprot:COSAG03_NODE_15723_length_422_cov_0.907121_2_plen_95_part_01
MSVSVSLSVSLSLSDWVQEAHIMIEAWACQKLSTIGIHMKKQSFALPATSEQTQSNICSLPCRQAWASATAAPAIIMASPTTNVGWSSQTWLGER